MPARLWKIELQHLADATGLRIGACHLPPGTSKWNEIEHRMVSSSTQNWRGRPLVCHEVVVNLIGSPTTQPGRPIRAERDTNHSPPGRKVTDAELADIRIEREPFHGEWNYAIAPRRLGT